MEFTGLLSHPLGPRPDYTLESLGERSHEATRTGPAPDLYTESSNMQPGWKLLSWSGLAWLAGSPEQQLNSISKLKRKKPKSLQDAV